MANQFTAQPTAPKPGTRTCDWCDDTHAYSFRLKRRGGQFVYACPKHHNIAQETANEAGGTRR